MWSWLGTFLAGLAERLVKTWTARRDFRKRIEAELRRAQDVTTIEAYRWRAGSRNDQWLRVDDEAPRIRLSGDDTDSNGSSQDN